MRGRGPRHRAMPSIRALCKLALLLSLFHIRADQGLDVAGAVGLGVQVGQKIGLPGAEAHDALRHLLLVVLGARALLGIARHGILHSTRGHGGRGRGAFRLPLGCYLSSLTLSTTVTENRQILTVTLMAPPFSSRRRLTGNIIRYTIYKVKHFSRSP